MRIRHLFSHILSSILVLLLLLGGSIGPAQAQDGDHPQLSPQGGPPLTDTFTYQGRLTDHGTPTNGYYDFQITIWDAPTGGTQIASAQILENWYVRNGLFSFQILPDHPMDEVFNGEGQWVQVKVRPHGTTTYTTLPRQPITAVPYAWSLRPGVKVTGAVSGDAVIYAENTFTSGYSNAISGTSNSSSGIGVLGTGAAASGCNFGVRGLTYSSDGTGVYGWAGSASGSQGHPVGVWGYSKKGHGVYGETLGDWSNISGVYGVAHYDHANGVNGVNTAGGYGVRGESKTGVGVAAKSESGNLIEAWDTSPSDRRFYVSNSGNVYADLGFHTPAADFAEMFPAQEGLEPGDVLVIGPDGKLARCSKPFQATVVGVYSTSPGFVGGSDEELTADGKVPLAVVGIVPAKVSAESGAVQPGDLLAASATPGHAMKAGANPPPGTVIGKALDSLDEGTGVIKMLVMVR
ncbi:MAG TPA: hypothetical protein EYH31_03945 [Anaerolineae bacterium]|nr:hypothetical protein [Anaerolineae bacterium]